MLVHKQIGHFILSSVPKEPNKIFRNWEISQTRIGVENGVLIKFSKKFLYMQMGHFTPVFGPNQSNCIFSQISRNQHWTKFFGNIV